MLEKIHRQRKVSVNTVKQTEHNNSSETNSNSSGSRREGSCGDSSTFHLPAL